MTKARQQELSEKFKEQWQLSRDWLVPFMQNNQPTFLTKDELRSAAMRELNVSKSAFDFGWMAAIEDTGRHDWYEPLRRRLRTKTARWKIFCTGLISSSVLTTSVMAVDLPRKAPPNATVADRCTKVEQPRGTPEIPGGDIFGFTNPTDIGDPCSWSFASENTGFVSKRDGSFFALINKSQFSYTHSDRFAFAFSAFSAYSKWSNVTAMQDTLASAGAGVIVSRLDRYQFDGFSAEFLLRLIARSPGQPVAVTVSMESRWSRIDLANSTFYPAQFYANEFKLFADVALTERLFAAVNVVYALATSKYGIAQANWVNGSATAVSTALTAQVHAAEKASVEGVFLGVEAHLLSQFSGLTLNQNVGNGFFAGPTLAIAFRGDRMLNLTWTPQWAGRARPPSAPGALDLDNFERHQFRVKYSAPLEPATR